MGYLSFRLRLWYFTQKSFDGNLSCPVMKRHSLNNKIYSNHYIIKYASIMDSHFMGDYKSWRDDLDTNDSVLSIDEWCILTMSTYFTSSAKLRKLKNRYSGR
jgi:hypothetical protein